MTSPHPPERAVDARSAILPKGVVRGYAAGRPHLNRTPLFAWSGSRSRIQFHSVGRRATNYGANGTAGSVSLVPPQGLRCRLALQTSRAERNSFPRDARFQFLAESMRRFAECLVLKLLRVPLLHEQKQTTERFPHDGKCTARSAKTTA